MIVWSAPQPAAQLLVTRQLCDHMTEYRREFPQDIVRCHLDHPMVARYITTPGPPFDLVGQRIAIASTDEEPISGRIGSFDITNPQRGPRLWLGPGLEVPLLRNAIVGSATVATVLEIVTSNCERWVELAVARATYISNEIGNPFVPTDVQGLFIRHSERTESGWSLTSIDISDQLPFADWSPGRFAVELADAAPCSERCPWCSKGGPHFIMSSPCPMCKFAGRCDPISHTAPAGWSEWTP